MDAMSLGTMLFNLVIGPLKMLFELLFSLVNRFGNPGISIVALSLGINLLVLPLYRRADAIQDAEREMEARLAPGVAHIRKTFSGDQRFMTLQAFYRANHYSQTYALKGLLPLMLEIPFFIAAYQFLSGLELLHGASFGPIRDLGAPDGLLALGGLRINVLPILMTGINLISGAVYTRGAPLKSKIQLYAMALVFLVLLYDSPAGLTMYWTLNNLFSLGKNIVTGLMARRRTEKPARESRREPRRKPNPGLFFLTAALLALLTGGLIPSAVIAASPSEFIDPAKVLHPFWYLASSLLLAAGSFVLWPGIYYLLGNPRMKKGMEAGIWILAGVMLVQYMAFHPNLGMLSSSLHFDELPAFSWREKGMNLGLLALAAGVMALLYFKGEKWIRGICLTGALAVAAMFGWNCVQAAPVIRTAIAAVNSGEQEEMQIPLSREGKNVAVIMLDRAISSYVPAMLAEKPELQAQFDGFVWYSNALSHGACTNFGAPGLFGGYEYTPWEMNARDTELLQDKHNEALLVMPRLFGEQEGYEVTVIDPPYAGNYAFVTDLSIYDPIPNTRAFRAAGRFGNQSGTEGLQHARLRNFFPYALCQTCPWIIYGTLYNAGFYNEPNATIPTQIRESMHKAEGVGGTLLEHLGVLEAMPELSRIREGEQGTLLVMANDATHNPQLLQEPEYEAAWYIDNTEYDEAHADRFAAGPVKLNVTDENEMAHYHVIMAAFLRLGKWFDWLRENGVYDNTRIILVSDHGNGLGLRENMTLENGMNLLFFNALLMVKDFGSHGEVRTEDAFITNADVPALAAEGITAQPKNPFSGKELRTGTAGEAPQKVTTSYHWDTGSNDGTRFTKADWYEVQDEVLDLKNWKYLGEY